MSIPLRVSQRRAFPAITSLLLLAALPLLTSAQQQKLVSCRPVTERTSPEGCWIIANTSLGTLLKQTAYWNIDRYETRESAERDKDERSTVVEALGKTWLLSIGAKPVSSQGHRVTRIGPLPIREGEAYTAQYMEATLPPGVVSRTHVHSGPEAFFTEAGESCLETPEGKQIGKKGTDIIVPEGQPMELLATGSEVRRGLILVLHSSSKPATTVTDRWKSKGLCSSRTE